MKYLAILYLILFITFPAFGQEDMSVSGIICDSTNSQTVEGAAIRILKSADSTFVMGGVSNNKGYFSINNLSKGQYIAEISYLGYQKYFRNFVLNKKLPNLNLKTVLLKADDIRLDEIVVTGKASELTVRGDTLEFNSGSYKLPPNSVINDLLKRLPGVEISQDGKITVNGKTVSKLLVDGKEFFSTDPDKASKVLPAEMIEKLQVIDRKSESVERTGFDDGSKETVINLKVKEKMKVALFGNANAGYGHDVKKGDNRYRAELVLNAMKGENNYMVTASRNNLGGFNGNSISDDIYFNMNRTFSEKFSMNLYANYNGSVNDTERQTNTETILDSLSSVYENNSSWGTDNSKHLGVSSRMEWKPTKNDRFLFNVGLDYDKNTNNNNESFSSYKNRTLDTLYYGNSVSVNNGHGYRMKASMQYTHKFKREGRTFSTALSGHFSHKTNWKRYDWSRYNFNDGIFYDTTHTNQYQEGDNKSGGFNLNLSYVEKIGEKNYIQFAYDLAYSRLDNVNSNFDLKLTVDSAYLNPNQSRSTERVNFQQRIMVNFKAVREKYDYLIGLNVDPNNSLNRTFQPLLSQISSFPSISGDDLPNLKGDSIVSDIRQNVINISPIASFKYKFDKNLELRFHYSGMTSQPSASQLQDYTDNSNPTNSVKGNPDLKPGYSNRMNLNFVDFNNKKQLFFQSGINAEFSLNNISSTVSLDPETGYRTTTFKNVNGNWSVAWRNSFNLAFKNKKFSFGYSSNLGYRNTRSFFNENLNTGKDLNFTFSPRASYRIERFNIFLSPSFNVSRNVNELQPDNNLTAYDYGVFSVFTWTLPWKIDLSSDISWSQKEGLSEGFNLSETIWNASVSKELFSKKYGAGNLRIDVYDILQDRKSIRRTITNNFIQDERFSNIQSYFLCSFVYKINLFPKNN